MQLSQLYPLLRRIRGCTFAAIDTETHPKEGVIKVLEGTQVILFTNKKSHGYERMLQRRLAQAGLPADFKVSEMKWGRKLPGSPLIEHKGKYYLQVILLKQGRGYGIVQGQRVTLEELKQYLGTRDRSETVSVRAYNLDSITGIRLLGESLEA